MVQVKGTTERRVANGRPKNVTSNSRHNRKNCITKIIGLTIFVKHAKCLALLFIE